MNFSPSSLTAAIGTKSAGTTTDTNTAHPASASVNDSSPGDTTIITGASSATATPTAAGSIRKVDDITPSPMRNHSFARPSELDAEKVMTPLATGENPFTYDTSTRVQDPPKQACTSTSSRAIKYFTRDLTSIDPPEVKALYPIFKFGGTTKIPTATTTPTTLTDPSLSNAATINKPTPVDPTTDSAIVDLTNTTNTTENDTATLTNIDPPSSTTDANPFDSEDPEPNPNVLNKTTYKETPSKQLDFSTTADDTTPLSSIKMAPIKKGTPTTRNSSLRKPSTKAKVVISSEEPDVRCYTKGSPATMKEPGGTIINDKPSPHNHKFKTVFEMSITIPKTERVLLELSNKMTSALAFIQQWADPTAAFLPKTNPTLPHIISKLSFPSVIFPLEMDYFIFSSSGWHYAPKQPRGKVIRLSAIIGSDVEPDMIARCKPDLNVMHVGLEIKAHQDIDTNTRITLLGAPNTINKAEAKKICSEIFLSALKILKSEHPDDPISNTINLPDFAIILQYPQGLPYVAKDDADYSPPSRERRSLHIMCASSDFDGFATLTEVAKANDLWRPSFGMCYPTIAPQVGGDDEKLDRYVRMIEIHESVQQCYANTPISGLSNVDREFTLCKDDGTSATFNVRKLLTHIKVWDPVLENYIPVFLCLLRCDDRCYHAYFPGGNDVITTYVEAFRKCPGPQLYFYLLKRRFLHGDVSKFIRSVFNLEQQALCSRAKYNKRTGMAYVQNTPDQMDIIDAACASNSGFTIQSVTRSPALQQMKYTGPKNTAMEYYDFTDGQSITTLKTAAKKPSNTKSDASIGLGESVYQPEGSTANSMVGPDNMDIDNNDDIGDDEFGNEFQFDLAALKEIEQTALETLTITDNAINSIPPPTPTPNTTTMSDADSKAIQEQLTLTLIARNKTSASLNIGNPNNDILVTDDPNFAVVLEEVTNKDYTVMLEIIDSISTAIDITDTDINSTSIAIPEYVTHPLFTTSLREALLADLISSEESLTDYLSCMRMAVEDALKITDGYLTTTDFNVDMEEVSDPLTSSTPALESTDSPAKLQGCTATLHTQQPTDSSVGVDGNMSSSASRLGADTE